MTANTDTSELHKFSKLAASWWDENGEFRTLHAINPLRLQFIQKHIDLTNKKVADIGCGGGILSETLAKSGATVTAIDMASEVLEIAKQHQQLNPDLKIDYQLITAEELAEKSAETFDVVTCMEMLEHVPDPVSVIAACSQLVKPGGTLFFSTLNRNLKAYLLAIVGAEYCLKLLPKGTHDYKKFIRPSELINWCRNQNLSPIAFEGIHYNPLKKTFSVNNDLIVNYMMCLRKT